MSRSRFPIKAMKEAAWPEADRAAWQTALAPRSGRSRRRGQRGGLAARWRPTTVANTAQAYGFWLAWCESRDALDRSARPADRFTLDQVELYVEALEAHLAPMTVANRIRNLAEAVRVLEPAYDMSWLRNIAVVLQASAKPSRNKAERTVYTTELVAAGERLMSEAGQYRFTPLEAANRFQDGLMIGLLARRPIRVKNLQAMTLGHHILVGNTEVRVRFEPSETKGKSALDFAWPVDLLEALHLFLGRYRPTLLKGTDSDKLWMANGRPLGYQGCQQRIQKATKRVLGTAIPPHFFRDSAATTVALLAPEQAAVIQSILGHTTAQTSLRHYNHAETVLASVRYQDELDAILAEPPKETAS